MTQRSAGSWAGLGLLVLLGLLYWARQGFFLLLVVSFMLFLLGSRLWVERVLRHVGVRRRISDHELVDGDSLEVVWSLHNRSRLPVPWVRGSEEPGLHPMEGELEVLLGLWGGGSAEMRYTLGPLPRGLHGLSPIRVEAAGPMGVLRREHRPDPEEGDRDWVTVLPRRVVMGQRSPGQKPLHEVPRRRSLFEDPSRFLGLRAYRPGDSPRRIHWRSTARSGTLQSRVYEPAVLGGLQLILEGSQEAWQTEGSTCPGFELAVRLACSLGESVLLQGMRVGLLSSGRDAAWSHPAALSSQRVESLPEDPLQSEQRPVSLPPSRDQSQLRLLQHALARVELQGSPPLAVMLEEALPRLPRGMVLGVITPRLDSALQRRLQQMEVLGLSLRVFLIGEASAARLQASLRVYPIQRDEDIVGLGYMGPL